RNNTWNLQKLGILSCQIVAAIGHYIQAHTLFVQIDFTYNVLHNRTNHAGKGRGQEPRYQIGCHVIVFGSKQKYFIHTNTFIDD
ncbi:hypothetical protein ACJX0J_015052, partial [Zea mays]